METKLDLIQSTIDDFFRIARTYACIEEMPISVDNHVTVTTHEAHFIEAIGRNASMNVTQVAACFGITKSGASQMVAKLVARGFLNKKSSAYNSKAFELSLTPLGWRAYNAHERLHGKDKAELVAQLQAFSISQIATLSVLLETISDVIQIRFSQRSGQ